MLSRMRPGRFLIEVQQTRDGDDFPAPHEVQAVYRAASAEPPLSESENVARLFGTLYATAIKNEQVVCVSARDDDRLVGLAYGHPWSWNEQRDSWSQDLNEGLGARATSLDNTFVISLLARDPGVGGAGLGRRLLDELIAAVDPLACWLVTTDIDSPARALYAARGFHSVGHGPRAPDGRPGLVMLRGKDQSDRD